MTMTRQERDVIQAVMRIMDEGMPHPVFLSDAVYALIHSCPDCNRGGHTCPGDGESIGHGDTDCGRHDDVAREIAQAPTDDPIWVLRTWADVRTGDDVRLPGTENCAHVAKAVHHDWQVDPRSGTGKFNPPRPLKWSGVHVSLWTTIPAPGVINVQESQFTMDPAKPVEIKTTQLELDAINLLGGWSARVGVITEETT